MADEIEVQRQLNEAVLPEKFSLESLQHKTATNAALRFTEEGWTRDDAQNLASIASVVVNPDEFPKSKLAALGDTTTRGAVTLVTAGNTEFGLTFGHGGRPKDTGNTADGQISHFEQQQASLDPRRGKAIGVYVGIKF